MYVESLHYMDSLLSYFFLFGRKCTTYNSQRIFAEHLLFVRNHVRSCGWVMNKTQPFSSNKFSGWLKKNKWEILIEDGKFNGANKCSNMGTDKIGWSVSEV